MNLSKPNILSLITCVNYADYLRLTLPRNAAIIENTVVLTSERDKDAIACCKELGVTCHVTETWFEAGAMFNKSRVLDEYVALSPDAEWVLTLDSDILLPRNFWKTISQVSLESAVLYGAKRRVCARVKDWNWYVLEEDSSILPMENIPMVQNASDDKAIAWGQIQASEPSALQGYFQLFHKPTYPEREFGDYPDHIPYDLDFAIKWEDSLRKTIPGMEVVHLGPVETNWFGRVSESWSHADPMIDL